MTYTIDDIYALPDDQRAELIDGRIYNMAPPLFPSFCIIFSNTFCGLPQIFPFQFRNFIQINLQKVCCVILHNQPPSVQVDGFYISC